MRSWIVTAHGNPCDELRLTQTAEPAPAAGEVLIRTSAAGLNYPDALYCTGQYHERPALPFTPGLEVCGRIEAVGPEVDLDLRVGQRVVAFTQPPRGGLAEQVTTSASDVYPIPDSLDDLTAAGILITYQTAYLALHHRAHLVPGETVLIHGAAGGVGSASIQVAKALGATVIATAGSPERAQRCRQLGADITINREGQDLMQRTQEVTDGKGVDVVIDPIGGDLFKASLRLLRFEGRYLPIGFTSGTIPTIHAGHVLVKNISIIGLHMALYRSHTPKVLRDTHHALMDLWEGNAIRPDVSEVISFDAVPNAIDRILNRRVVGKLVVLVQ